MSINEQIVTGRKFRKLIDEASRLWLRVSFWSKASDVEFDDGEDAETKFSNIQTIINNIKGSFNNFKDSVQNSLNNIHDNLGGCKIEQEGDNFFIIGADSVRKKLGDVREGIHVYQNSAYAFTGGSGTYLYPHGIDTDKYEILYGGFTSTSFIGRAIDTSNATSDSISTSFRLSWNSTNAAISYTYPSAMRLADGTYYPCSVSYFLIYIEK